MKRSDDKPLSRREFARRAALGTAAVIAPAPLVYPERTEGTRRVYPEHAVSEGPLLDSAQEPPAAAKLSPQSRAEAEARHQAILTQYPDRFSDAQKADLKRLCFVLQPQLDSLRAWTVGNSDQPALYLKPLVEREKKTNAPPNLKAASSQPAAAPAPKPANPGKP